MDDLDFFSASTNIDLIQRKYFRTTVVWKIANVQGRTPHYGDFLLSPTFKCSNAFWQLILFARGEARIPDDVNDNNATLHVHRLNNSLNLNFITYLKLDIFDDKGNELCEFTSPQCKLRRRGSHDRVCLVTAGTTNQLLLSQDPLTIIFTISVEESSIPAFAAKKTTKLSEDEKKEPFRLDCSSTSLSADFEELHNNPKFSDVTLKVGEEVFQAHRSVLSARSKVFAAMFDHDLKENREHTVDLVHMEAETVRDMLRYIYCGKVREFSPEEALNLYVAADRYELQELTTVCREVILNNICINNVCDIASVAELHNDESLISAVKPFIAEHGKEIIKTEKWKTISTSNSLLCAKMFEWAFSE